MFDRQQKGIKTTKPPQPQYTTTMETYIKAAHVIQEELEANGYDVDVGVNRITETLNVNINTHGSPDVEDILPPAFTQLETDDQNTYLFTIENQEQVNQFIDESYDTDEFEDE